MAKWIIEDWTSHQVTDEEFDSFEEARERIYELATIEADNNFETDTPEWEELYQGLCEDLYATKVRND